MSKAVGEISDDGNIYYIILDTAIDNPDVLRELTRLKRNISGKNNVKIIKVHSFEFSLLSFEFLEQWVFAEEDELKEKRSTILQARNIFVGLIQNGGNSKELSEFKSVYHYQNKMNTEKISSKLLYDITRNTGFETNKSQVGECFINSCCEWSSRQEDDICGLENKRLTLSEKMIPQNMELIALNDVYFNKYTVEMLDEKAHEIIEKIDHSKMLSKYTISSRFNGTALDIDKLSTGCKTILNIMYNLDKIFDICDVVIMHLMLFIPCHKIMYIVHTLLFLLKWKK